MRIERWNPVRHIPILREWLQGWRLTDDAGDARLYPSTGFVIDRTALGFVYATNAPLVGYIDGIITDPAVEARQRLGALRVLCSALVDESDALGIRLLWATTSVRGLTRICKAHDFVPCGEGFVCTSRYRR